MLNVVGKSVREVRLPIKFEYAVIFVFCRQPWPTRIIATRRIHLAPKAFNCAKWNIRHLINESGSHK